MCRSPPNYNVTICIECCEVPHGDHVLSGGCTFAIPEARSPKLEVGISQSFGGLVLADKVDEPLRVALDAYNDHVTPLTKIPRKLQEYPNP